MAEAPRITGRPCARRGLHWESWGITSFVFTLHVALYRLLGGRLVGRNILILSTMGRRTRRRRSTPLFFVVEGEDYVIIASNGGEARYPGWWYNIHANPHVEVEVGRHRLRCTAHRVTAKADADRLFSRLGSVFGGYAKYRQQTTRELTMFRLRPSA